MNAQKTTAARLAKLLIPAICLVLLLAVPAMNPGRFMALTSDWSYLTSLKDAMAVDQVFSRAYPGVRVLFASNSQLTFCTFVLGIALLVQLAGAAVSVIFAKAKKFFTIGNAIMLGGAVMGVVGGLVSIFSAVGANGIAAQNGIDIQYMVPLGSVVLTLESLVMALLFWYTRRQHLIETKSLIKMTKLEKIECLKGYAFISPYLIGFTVFTAYPLIFSAFSSFTYYNITAVQKWYGLTNYTKLFTGDDLFWQSLGNTLYYVVFSVPLVIILALVLALLMNTRIKGMGFFRTVYYLPSVLSGVAVYLLWQWIFDPSNGLLNNGLALLGIQGPAWLYDANWTKPALIIMRLWSTGGTMILLLAALQNVPVELYEAGELDGAVGFSKFFHITLPMISPTLFFVMVTGISGAFQVYDSAYIMVQNGGPGKSLMFYNLYLFNTAFTDQMMGKASAMAWVLFAIIMCFTLVQQIASKKWVYYDGGTDK